MNNKAFLEYLYGKLTRIPGEPLCKNNYKLDPASSDMLKLSKIIKSMPDNDQVSLSLKNTTKLEDESIFKPIIRELIQYYYEVGNNPTSGYLHIVTDDGNLADENLYYCQELCRQNNDLLGLLIATILRCFTAEEREEMYEIDRWSMKNTNHSLF